MRLIDADAILEKAWDADTRVGYVQVVDVGDILEEPTVEVVRCKGCVYGEQDEIGRWFCRNFGCPVGNDDGSGYCADGERREDEAD